jgi:hypothetical protein
MRIWTKLRLVGAVPSARWFNVNSRIHPRRDCQSYGHQLCAVVNVRAIAQVSLVTSFVLMLSFRGCKITEDTRSKGEANVIFPRTGCRT